MNVIRLLNVTMLLCQCPHCDLASSADMLQKLNDCQMSDVCQPWRAV